VIDYHVVIGELFAAREIKPVEDALQAFAGEMGVNVRAGEFRAERDRVGEDVAGAAEVCRERGDVKRLLAFILKLEVFDDRVVARHEFGDGVGEIGRIA